VKIQTKFVMTILNLLFGAENIAKHPHILALEFSTSFHSTSFIMHWSKQILEFVNTLKLSRM